MNTETIEIEKLDVSARLKNCMRRNDMVYLHDAAKFSKESLLKIRNMGIETYNELQEQCEKYCVVIHSVEELKDKSRGINWSWNQCYYLFKLGIRTIDDIKSFPMEEVEKTKYEKPELYGRLKDAKRKLESE